ncbi:MltR family transcriptional regulator [Bradyrhizobium sp. LA2.1]|uniref:MltR family transcriptional regulator n=1 Tax=Bradyrhizobium sp. LA2.1 TaxID=3156376 RepID=UPI003395DF72
MSTWTLEGEKEGEIISALLNETDRAAAIIAGTIVEDRLSRKLKANLRNDDTKLVTAAVTEMFRSSGPLGVFANKIRLGYLMRLYGSTAYKDLVAIKDIRNLFAHKMDILSFKTNEIANLCQNLKIVESYFLLDTDKSRLFNWPQITNGTFSKEDWDTLTLHNSSIMGTVYTKDRQAVLGDNRERFLSSCGIFMSHLSFNGEKVPLFFGDEQPPST